MYDSGKIIFGLALFAALLAVPFLMNIGGAGEPPKPELSDFIMQKPEADRKCVEPRDYMRKNHMQLLDTWRDAASRKGQRVYVNSEGIEFNISLQNTCMNCHSNKKEFCDKCHDYLSVKPYCWDCHLSPIEPGDRGEAL